jgi:hypothetical protein
MCGNHVLNVYYTICSTCDVHTYIEHVKNARLAGIFYWSQFIHFYLASGPSTPRVREWERDVCTRNV